MTALGRLFSEGFRVFFLAATLYALLAIGLWEAWLAAEAAGAGFALPAAMDPQQWHAHEMIFGYAGAALGGFFLTAVPNWTGAKGAPRRFIATVAGLWLLGRLAMLLSGLLPPVLVAVADLSFVPVLGAKLMVQLVRRPKGHQLIFLAVLALFWTANLFCHLDWWAGIASAVTGLRAGLLTLSALIVILGGRIIPGFTRNAMVQSGRETGLPANPAPLAVLAIAAALVLPLGYLLAVPPALLGWGGLVAGAAALARVLLWRGAWTLRRPILWTLHLGYAFNAAGLIALGLANLGIGAELGALHLLAIGGVGVMTVSVMSRASLGHTGRPLIAPRPVALAYGLIPVAALLRYGAAGWPDWYYPLNLGAGAIWLLAFALLAGSLAPIVLAPRLPRAPTRPAPQ